MMALPSEFLHSHAGPGGGVIQSIASETVFFRILAARAKTVALYLEGHPEMEEMEVISKRVGYSSDQVQKTNDILLHIDAAYAGSAFVCPEYRKYMEGVEHAMAFSTNPHKWMLINFDCSVMWQAIKDSRYLVDAFNVDPIYLRHENEGKVPDYRHWQIPLGRRFRSLKLWFMLRFYGVEGVHKYIRTHCNLAHHFKDLILDDGRFELAAEVVIGLDCFRLKGDDIFSETLHDAILANGRIYLIPAIARDVYFL